MAVERLLPKPGETEQSHLFWLTQFLNLDLSVLSLRDFGNILLDVRWIAKFGISRNSAPFPKWELIPNGQTRPDGQTDPYPEWAVRRDLLGYQTVLRKAVVELASTKRTILHLGTSMARPSIAFEIDHGRDRRHPALIILKADTHEILQGFDLRILFVLQRAGQDLAMCKREDCGAVFLRSRTDKQVCSKMCGTLERVRKWRTKKKLEQRASDYVASQKRAQSSMRRRRFSKRSPR